MEEDFQDRIIITEINGKANVVTFRTKAKKILHDFYEDTEDTEDEECKKQHIIVTAAKLIRDDIKAIECDMTSQSILTYLNLPMKMTVSIICLPH